MSTKLDGKVAIVTGSTSGIGRAIAVKLASAGASVVVSGRDRERGERILEKLQSAGGHAIFVAGDVSTEADNRRLVDAAFERFGRVDILSANAGMLGNGRVTDLSEETWQSTLQTNLGSVFYLMKHGIPAMLQSGGGSIVVCGSIAAWMQFPAHPAYCASKAGVLALVKQVALDYGPDIRANVICPGQVDTPMLWQSAGAFADPAGIIQDNIDQHIVMKRLGTPQDIANAALFLVSEEASWITGASLRIDGGRMLGG